MSKKKRFGISDALTRGLTETINVVENSTGLLRHVILPLSRIELDPDNPRQLAINLQDIRFGIKPDDAFFQQKQAELEKLKELAHTIQSSGVINPIIVYKLGDHYRIVAGERRCLASILAGKEEIEARVFNEKPKKFELTLMQWIENTAREDLSLEERLENIKVLLREYRNEHPTKEVTASLLKEITGLSLPQCSYYLAVVNAPDDLRIYIRNGQIRNLDKAAFIANISETKERHLAIEACINGASLKEIKKLSTTVNVKTKLVRRGRKGNKVNLGTTQHSEVVKTIVDCVMMRQEFQQYQSIFTNISWTDLRQVAMAFKKLIEILELEVSQ